ncbi:FAD-dependent oxidoreductase [Vibrio fluvialis]|nr:FAD-dependent oxidoreductase [Vibrio vulnificus]MBY7897384.1 FAD-dependent oxidoreductase [Vibrio fluvialis]MBY8084752.1 FAD-dependent oxidoreductase [Vibrio fluvialis]
MIVVIGGGVTGLAFAAATKGDVVILEADSELGGYCRTTYLNGFVWDRAGHFFHFNNHAAKSFFNQELINEVFIEVEKVTSIYWKGRMIDFPFQNNIHQLPKELYSKCLVDLYNAEKGITNEISTFKDFIYSNLGKTISEEFLIPYNEKLYACDLDNLDKDAMGRFFPKTTFENVLLSSQANRVNSYNQKFSYPRKGAKTFVDVLEKHARKNAEIRLNTRVSKIDVDSKHVILESGETVKYDILINTSPFDKLLSMTSQKLESSALTANKVAVFNLGFDSKTDVKEHWTYFPGDEIFYRVGCYHNIFSEERASLYVEIGLTTNDIVNKDSLLQKVLDDLKRVGFVNESMSLIESEFVVMDPAYVHVNNIGEKLKSEMKEKLAGKSVYTAGRYGDWKYCSIEDNMLEAVALSKHICSQYPTAGQFESLFGDDDA